MQRPASATYCFEPAHAQLRGQRRLAGELLAERPLTTADAAEQLLGGLLGDG